MDEETQDKKRPGPTANSREENRPVSERFQFSLRSLFLLMIVGAVIASGVTAIPLPDGFKIVFLLYLLFMTAYLLLRLPFLLRGIFQKTPGWQKLRQERENLEQFIEEKQRKPKDPT